MQTPESWLSDVLTSLSLPSASDTAGLLEISNGLLKQFQKALQASTEKMLPSYIHTLPTGKECGIAAAVDLGGSTLRVAIIQLLSHHQIQGSDQSRLREFMQIIARQDWSVRDDIKRLRPREFFDWVVGRIASVLRDAGHGNGKGLVMGVTWSFPVTQTSLASGKVQQMGKGYRTFQGIEGTDLRGHFERSMRAKGILVDMVALLNDTEATLLSHAYANPATRISLICGTGCNAAIQLPVTAIGTSKFGQRPRTWTRKAKQVLVNTEISMFGGQGILPLSFADLELDRSRSQPGFQPLEQLVGGRYLGEICRLTLLDGVRKGALFRGVLPEGLQARYSLDTSLLGAIEGSPPGIARKALREKFKIKYPLPLHEMESIKRICHAISERAATVLAVAMFTLWRLRQDELFERPQSSRGEKATGEVAIAYCGAVLEKHPFIRKRTQEVLDLLVEQHLGNQVKQRLVLEGAGESGLLGAAVAAVMNRLDRGTRVEARL